MQDENVYHLKGLDIQRVRDECHEQSARPFVPAPRVVHGVMMTDTPDAKLIAASLSDPIVAAMFAAYRHGAYESWQDALAVLALALLDRNKALEAALTRSMGGSTLLPTIFR